MNKNATKSSKRKEEENKTRKQNESSSDSDETLFTDCDSEDEMDVHEYRKFLKNIFPSKHLDNKIKAGEKLKQTLSDSDEDDEDYEEEIKPTKKMNKTDNKKQSKSKQSDDHKQCTHKNKPRYNLRNRVIVSDQETGDEDEYENNDEDKLSDSDDLEDDDEYTEDEHDHKHSKKGSKFNIIFTIGGKENDYDNDEDYDDETNDTCSGSNTENEDDPISSDSDSEHKKNDKPEKSKDNKSKNDKINAIKESLDDKMLINKIKDAFGITTQDSSSEKENSEEDLISILKDLQSKNKNNELVNECLRVCETKIKNNKEKQEKRIKKEKARNSRIFQKILRDKNTTNDFEFYDKLETSQQYKIIKELREINKITRVEKPYRLTLLESDIPVTFKATAMKKISSLRYMEQGSGEFYKIKNWVDTFMRIPFGNYKTLPINISDGVEKCHDFMENAQKILDDAVYGLNDAKMQIMQMLGQLITNPKSIGSAIAIHGPPGTGKTSLVKEGISKILNRPFAFIALGGATDSSFLEGHGYTYEGSTWGKIVQILIDSKCMNPVIYFDELDKISDTPKGEEIAGILTHLTDTSQNSQFHDKYFAEIDFDLSKCLFIFSYNDETKVNPILKDRMYRIQTKGYNQKQKTAISNNYLLPRIREQVKFAVEDIIIPDQTLHYMIDNHCNKEDGVRNLKRCLEIIYTKLNLYRLMRPGSNLFEEDMSLKVEFPFTVTKDIVDKLIKKSDNEMNPSLYHLYL
jgi:ATP-dependent Lon protease